TNCSVDELFWMNNTLVAATHGRGMFRVDFVPSNDNFANAQLISGNSGTVIGSNLNASKETGEPNHAGNVGGASVWYQWQAPANGSATIDTAGSNFNTLLGVYTGNSVNGLTTIASNDDDTDVLTSKVVFNAINGSVYRIAVDGF